MPVHETTLTHSFNCLEAVVTVVVKKRSSLVQVANRVFILAETTFSSGELRESCMSNGTRLELEDYLLACSLWCFLSHL